MTNSSEQRGSLSEQSGTHGIDIREESSEPTTALPPLLRANLGQIALRGGAVGVILVSLLQGSSIFLPAVPLTMGLCICWVILMGYWVRLGLVAPTAAALSLRSRRVLFRWTLRVMWLVLTPLTLKLAVVPLFGVVAAPGAQLAFAWLVWAYASWLWQRDQTKRGLHAGEWLLLSAAMAAFLALVVTVVLAWWLLSYAGVTLGWLTGAR